MRSPNSSETSKTPSATTPEAKTLLRLQSKLTPELVKSLPRTELLRLLAELRSYSGLLKKRLVAGSLPEFMREILELKTPPHILEWARLLETHKQMVVEASRDHAKSWTFSYAWPLYNLQKTKEPVLAEHIALISYSEEQAKKNLTRIRKAIETIPALAWLMPKAKSYSWDAQRLDLQNGAMIEAFGFGSSIRGGHYHKIVIDDPTKDHWTMALEEQINFFYGVVLPACRRGGQIVVTGNPVERNDLLGQLEANLEYKTFKYPCWSEKEGRLVPLWPEQYTIEDLRARQRQMPPHLFAREYLLLRVSADDAKFREEWFRYYDDGDLDGKRLYKIMTIDPAISPGANADALAAVVTGTDKDGNTYVLDRLRYRGDFKTGVAALCEVMERNMPEFVGIENFAFQRMYKVWLAEEMEKRHLQIHLEEVGSDSRKSKAMRIEAIQPKLASGRLFFKRGDHKPLVDQFLMWDPRSKTNDDDEIDALAWQVPMWQAPYGDGPAMPKAAAAGSFREAFEQIASRDSSHYLSKLFADMRHQ